MNWLMTGNIKVGVLNILTKHPYVCQCVHLHRKLCHTNFGVMLRPGTRILVKSKSYSWGVCFCIGSLTEGVMPC